ncbi:type II toxin-antitoxin system RelE/ParE family toxin [Paraburkholderia sp. J94]|uniref:type II toxin-antitoxin system RelE/ParE family toxin n=1 Tax=Paraburkholderia sp. J94 TaxID=2805441 RepID=UPI002AAFD9F4|nr:type II toxin-antitoxin system RelE/ParE family toxin [Paraburkholderia sp. J94]
MTIVSFACRDTAALFAGRRIPRFVAIEAVAMRKLQQVHAAVTLSFLRVPGRRQEPSNGDLAGSYSIRINGQWRICFDFANGEASQVRIIDYH